MGNDCLGALIPERMGVEQERTGLTIQESRFIPSLLATVVLRAQIEL